MKKGLFITFEGIDGSGKSTQVQLLYKFLKHNLFKVVKSREPGGVSESEKIREILLYSKEIPAEAETLLLLASRNILVKKFVKPYLKKGYIVLLDRYIDSTIAYQGYARGFNLDFLFSLNRFATYNLEPDITFLLDVDVKSALSRQNKNLDRIEKEGFLFFKKVREGYLQLAKQKRRFFVIDAHLNREQIFSIIRNKIIKLLLKGF